MNGWFFVYLLAIVLNCIMTNMHGFSTSTWQHWAWFALIVLAYIAGRCVGG